MKVFARFAGSSAAAALLLAAAPSRSAPWLDTRVGADNVEVAVDRAGMAVVTHDLTLRIQGGPLKTFDLAAGDVDAVPAPEASAIPTQVANERPSPSAPVGVPIPLQLESRPDGVLRLVVERPGGLPHGTYVLHFGYRTSLLARGGIARDGAMLQVRWLGPVLGDGIDNARCVFTLPLAPTPPKAGAGNGVAPDGDGRGPTEADGEGLGDAFGGPAFLSEVHREASADRVELARPHVAKGEAVPWTVRVDPKALDAISDPRLRPPTRAHVVASSSSERRFEVLLAVGGAVLWSLLVALKARRVAEASRREGISPRPLVSLSWPLRALLSGPALALGVVLEQRLDDPRMGAAAVLVATALTFYRIPRLQPLPRGPGSWVVLSDADALCPLPSLPGNWLDATHPIGLAALLLALTAWGVVVRFVARSSPYDALALSYDVVPLLALFCTGGLRSMPLAAKGLAAVKLAAIARRVRARAPVRVVAWARLPVGADVPDEQRLLVVPRVPPRGLVGIEVGCVPMRGLGGYFTAFEVLIRVIDGSPCHDRLTQLLGGPRWVRGRKADERVVSVTPRLPTMAMTALLVRRLVVELRDGREPRAAGPLRDGRKRHALPDLRERHHASAPRQGRVVPSTRAVRGAAAAVT